jgi:hypothetical protein
MIVATPIHRLGTRQVIPFDGPTRGELGVPRQGTLTGSSSAAFAISNSIPRRVSQAMAGRPPKNIRFCANPALRDRAALVQQLLR